jgi:hypothetical protein
MNYYDKRKPSNGLSGVFDLSEVPVCLAMMWIAGSVASSAKSSPEPPSPAPSFMREEVPGEELPDPPLG